MIFCFIDKSEYFYGTISLHKENIQNIAQEYELDRKSDFLQTKDVFLLNNTLFVISLYKYSSLKGDMHILVYKQQILDNMPKTPKLSIHSNTTMLIAHNKDRPV